MRALWEAYMEAVTYLWSFVFWMTGSPEFWLTLVVLTVLWAVVCELWEGR